MVDDREMRERVKSYKRKKAAEKKTQQEEQKRKDKSKQARLT